VYKGDDGEAHGDAGNLVCAKCGRLLIAPLGSDKPNYCWHCEIEYREIRVKPYERKKKG